MHKTHLLFRYLFAFFAFATLLSPADAPVPGEIENEQMLGINKLPYHATLMPYGGRAEALAANRYASSWCRSLNGSWKFNWVPRPEQRPVDFYRPSFDVSSWKEIPVPSNWQVLGYGTPYYRNSGYTIRRDWPRVMSEPPQEYTAYQERNPVGSYRREFEVPEKWNGRRIFITFDGVDSAFFLWINGEKAGFSVNSRNAAEFDITSYVKPGKNMIAAEVYRYSAGTYLEDQDMWRLSGIFRNVTLWSAPQIHIRDFFVKTDLDPQYRDGTLLVAAKVHNYANQPSRARKLTVDLASRDGRTIPGASATADVPALEVGEEKSVSVSIPVSHPAKWTAETPNLYTTVLTMSGEDGGEILSTHTGFRKIEIKGSIFTINGVAVKLKGANRHEMWPDTGHYVSEEKMIRDLELLKQVNANHVRTSHYSDDPRWYELCDEYGIYLVAEANVECHGYMGVLDREPRWEKAIVDRNVANVENFKNHPSVIIWSLGNENGGGINFVSAVKAVKAIDPDRPTHYEPFRGRDIPTDIESRMYTAVADVENAAKDPNRTKPFYLCEYVHAMNNSMGAIGEYNDLFDKYPSLMGGAIWEWQDQGLWNRRDPNHSYLAYGGGFGEVPNDHYFIHKGVVFSDRSPKPHYPEVKRAYQWIGFAAEDLAAGKIRIRNKYAFTDLNGFAGSWVVTEDGTPIDHGTIGRLNLAPGTDMLVAVAYKKIVPKPGAEYFLQLSFALAKDEIWAKAGYEVAAVQFKLPVAAPAVAGDPSTLKPLRLVQEADRVTASGDGFSVIFDKIEGGITQLVRDGTPLLLPGGGPKMNLWRAPHRSDDDWAERDWKMYGVESLQTKVIGFRAEQTKPTVIRIEAVIQAEGRVGWSVTHSAIYTVYGDGSIVVDNALMPQGRRIPLARLGVRLLLDKRFDQFTYLGRGPMENYADRKRGSDLGLYTSTVREQLTPYAKPMESGNHEDVRWAALTGAKFPGLFAQSGDGLMQVSALPYTDEELTIPEYSVDLPAISATVVSLNVRTLGVGTASCGPRPLDSYIVWSDPIAFTYALRLVPTGQRNLSALGQTRLPQDRVKPVLGLRDSHGMVTLSCATSGSKIEYAVDGNSWQVYTAPFEFKREGKVSLRATAAGITGFAGAVAFGTYDQRMSWRVLSSSSVQRPEGEAVNVLDGADDTSWITRSRGMVAPPPHSIVIDFGEMLNVASVLYTARAESTSGRVKEYEIYLSEDSKQWGLPAAKGLLALEPLRQTITLERAARGRYLRFVILSEHTDAKMAAIAELNVVLSK